VSVSASGQGGDGRGGACSNVGGCSVGTGSGAFGLSFPQVAAGYAHLFTPNVGFLVGGTMFTFRDQRAFEWYTGSTFVLFGTVQTDEHDDGPGLAVGGGVDLGAGAASLEAAAELTIHHFDADFDLGLAAFTRRTIPYRESDPRPGLDFNPSVWSYELGARVIIGPVFLEYSYFRLDRGFVYYEAWETASFSEGLHIVTLGVLADGRAFFSDRGR